MNKELKIIKHPMLEALIGCIKDDMLPKKAKSCIQAMNNLLKMQSELSYKQGKEEILLQVKNILPIRCCGGGCDGDDICRQINSDFAFLEQETIQNNNE